MKLTLSINDFVHKSKPMQQCVKIKCTWRWMKCYIQVVWNQRRYCSLPIMHCFQWDILHRWTCGSSETKTYLKCKIWNDFLITNNPCDSIYKISNWKQCIVERPLYLLWCEIAKELDTLTTRFRLWLLRRFFEP